MGGNLIREARKRARLTQRELGERIGVTQSAIARWERNASEPSYATVMRAVRAAGFSVDIHLEPDDGSDLAQARQMLRRDVDARAAEITRVTNMLLSARAQVEKQLRSA